MRGSRIIMSDEDNKYEPCIMCGKETNVLVNIPINARKNYILGCGQLCENCAIELEMDNKSDELFTDEEMALLLDTIRKNKK